MTQFHLSPPMRCKIHYRKQSKNHPWKAGFSRRVVKLKGDNYEEANSSNEHCIIRTDYYQGLWRRCGER